MPQAVGVSRLPTRESPHRRPRPAPPQDPRIPLALYTHRDLADITQITPPPVLADALGCNPQTAIRHDRRGSGQYGAYVADRIHADT
ncbi:hypothetical protein MMAD_27960 [Mycolicibacterium madagascariense]|uniref:Uncharacterized protein n=1 Tax=Mycolicibacterium madagascariense TaxID=212765 RepID=A0A7I7XH38_9MYCO|nr:hypothetical protein MMAD_27960 [Mycolicibacterium madagascariense]